MKNEIKYLKDYKPTDFTIDKVNLEFVILEDKIVVTSTLKVTKQNASASNLVLNGSGLATMQVQLNGVVISNKANYALTDNTLTVFNVKSNDEIKTIVHIDPFANTSLMGIYKSNSCLCSQCEPEGFRKITWYIDRPDVMAVWKVSIEADKSKYPHLLSNGNKVETLELPNNRHKATFVDLLPKPSYLFALVAGNFDVLQDTFTTKSNRKVDLAVYVEQGKLSQADFAMESLKKSMKWDEDTFNLEYELDVFSIVAVSDFNFGAMENKSLNIFNDTLVLANPEIATDNDYFNIEAVVAHEYFHNFTGNRITCRDWFQLTLKEGLTVYRDQRFSADMHNPDITRINDVNGLKVAQFAEDRGSLSHPIRPTSYIEMNNFYTATVYEKGAEVIRMIETIIGKETFKKGIDVYFEKFDGMAVTCEDFILAMETASGKDFTKFKNWYLQAGTPVVDIETNYNATNQTFTVNFTQHTKVMPEHNQAFELVIPLKLALFNNCGNQLNLQTNCGVANVNQHLFILDTKQNSIVFNNITQQPVLSVNRGFSAPVIINYNYTKPQLQTLITHDTDGVVRYNAMQDYLLQCIINQVNNLQTNNAINQQVLESDLQVFNNILSNYNSNIHLTAILLQMPALSIIKGKYTNNLPLHEIITVLDVFENTLTKLYYNNFVEIFNNLQDNPQVFSAKEMAIRSLKNTCLFYIAKQQSASSNSIVLNYYKNNTNITNKLGAMVAIKPYVDTAEYKEIYADFYNRYSNHSTALYKWFRLSASSQSADIISHWQQLTKLNTFSFANPNSVRYLVGGIFENTMAVHNLDGSGYNYIKDLILTIDELNSSVSSGIAKAFTDIAIHTPQRQAKIKEMLNIIISNSNISKGLFEVVDSVLKQ